MRLYAPMSLLKALNYNGCLYRDVLAFWHVESRVYEHTPPFEEYILNYEESITENLVISYFTEGEALRLKAWLAELEGEDLYLMRPAPLVMNGEVPPDYRNASAKLVVNTPLYTLPFKVWATLDFHMSTIKVNENLLDVLINKRQADITVKNYEIEQFRAMSERDYYISPEELKEFEGLLDDECDPFGENKSESALQAWADFNANEFYRHLRTATPCS